MTPQAFVAKWKPVTLTERASSQPHFIDLCALLGQQTPAEADPTGEWYAFEKGASKSAGGEGWADVWRRACFAWEYKGPGRDLDKAYQQLQQYRESLENPPLLIVSDIQTIQVHTNFTNTVKQVHDFTLDDLLDPRELDRLRWIFTDPGRFKAGVTTAAVTEVAAAEFAKLAESLRYQQVEPGRAAHFLIRLLFCLFAEDIGLLPGNIFARLVENMKNSPDRFTLGLRALFGAMATGGTFGADEIPHFDGRLFDDAEVIPLSRTGLGVLARVAKLDWSSIEPAIFGTLFERSLDPATRAQLGAQYTSRDDIVLVVEPVLMAPLRRKWATVQAEALGLAATRDDATAQQRAKIDTKLTSMLMTFMRELATIRVLDPACGSGNFLYVALLLLLDLWKEVWLFMGELGLQRPMALEDVTPSPSQLHGIEINEFAAELAKVTIWIGYIQWLRDNGFGTPTEPILKPLDTIEKKDAILTHNADGRSVEPEWPVAEVIIGNPPFLGGKLMRQALSDDYIDRLFTLYNGRVPREADLVTYWYERARAAIADGRAARVGLLATNSIRGGANRRVLERIKASGDLFMAWADRDWILDGAAVRVSMVGFDDGTEAERMLDGHPVRSINADLTGALDLTQAHRIPENAGLAFMGDTKGGAFDIPADTAVRMITAPLNPNGRPNLDVVRPWVNGMDVTRRPRSMWIIDFGVDMSEDEAALYELPFEYVRTHIFPERSQNRRDAYRQRWWIHVEPRPAMRAALLPLMRFIVTPRVSKHRLFAWLDRTVLADSATITFARDDDYFFGALQSRPHDLWSLRMCTWLGVGNDPRYTPTTTFETFPFPWPPGHEPTADPRVTAIADAARDLVEKRDRWLNPEGATEADLKKRTLTNLYNLRQADKATWLDLAHKKLDAAVFDAYGWPHDIGDEAILERLLALNLERAGSGPLT